jgi:hypothetical protein
VTATYFGGDVQSGWFNGPLVWFTSNDDPVHVQVLSTEEDRQRRSRGESAAQRGAAVKASLAAAFAVAAVVAVCLAATNQVQKIRDLLLYPISYIF